MFQTDIKARLIADIPQELHKEVKRMALFRNTTLRLWIIEAIIEKIQRDER